MKPDFKVEGHTSGKKANFINLEIVWWGWSQSHKWRWNRSHIDMGFISIYNLPQKGILAWFWKFIAFLCKPLRKRYHRIYIENKPNKLEEFIKDLRHFK